MWWLSFDRNLHAGAFHSSLLNLRSRNPENKLSDGDSHRNTLKDKRSDMSVLDVTFLSTTTSHPAATL
jgi:hypothetical protein